MSDHYFRVDHSERGACLYQIGSPGAASYTALRVKSEMRNDGISVLSPDSADFAADSED